MDDGKNKSIKKGATRPLSDAMLVRRYSWRVLVDMSHARLAVLPQATLMDAGIFAQAGDAINHWRSL